MNVKRLTSLNYLKATLVMLLLSGMTLAAWHVYECPDEHNCTTCIVQKSATGFLITTPDTEPTYQHTANEIDEPASVITEDIFASATASRAPPAILL